MSLDDSNKDWRKHVFESKLENISDMIILNDMNPMYDNKVNNIAEYNVLHGILNNSKGTKNINHHYLPILRGCMNTSRIFESYCILDVVSRL